MVITGGMHIDVVCVKSRTVLCGWGLCRPSRNEPWFEAWQTEEIWAPSWPRWRCLVHSRGCEMSYPDWYRVNNMCSSYLQLGSVSECGVTAWYYLRERSTL